MYTNFHTSNILLHQQNKERHFTKYSELIAWFLVVEQNNELLLKNHQSHPIGFVSLLEANAISVSNHRRGHGHGHYYRRGCG